MRRIKVKEKLSSGGVQKLRPLAKKTSTCLVEHIIFIYCQLKEEREVLGLLRHGSEARAISLSSSRGITEIGN